MTLRHVYKDGHAVRGNAHEHGFTGHGAYHDGHGYAAAKKKLTDEVRKKKAPDVPNSLRQWTDASP